MELLPAACKPRANASHDLDDAEVLGERECSVQRRHQKLIEESPSVAVTPEIRKTISEKIAGALSAVGYSNAGTVEFVMDSGGDLYFIEVNACLDSLGVQ